jgi:hypothetical protein
MEKHSFPRLILFLKLPFNWSDTVQFNISNRLHNVDPCSSNYFSNPKAFTNSNFYVGTISFKVYGDI